MRGGIACAVIWLATSSRPGQPIGLFGFLAALVATTIVVAVLFIARGGRMPSRRQPLLRQTSQWRHGGTFRFLPLSRARGAPASAQAEIDAINRILPSLKQTLSRIDTLDPAAQDARRLMSIHLPGLIDRYVNVPPVPAGARWRRQDRRSATRATAWPLGGQRSADVSEQLARGDVAALETQGRFIESRYGEHDIEGQGADS